MRNAVPYCRLMTYQTGLKANQTIDEKRELKERPAKKSYAAQTGKIIENMEVRLRD